MLNNLLLKEYARKHEDIVQSFESATFLMHQLVNGKYSSFDVYLNNVSHLLNKLISTSKILIQDSKFELYILEFDAPLFYNIQSLVLSVQMLNNMLDNLQVALTTCKVVNL